MNKLVKLFSIIALSASITLVSCKGDKGDVGPQGNAGTAGKDGTNGTNGTNGVAGVVGAAGKDGNANVISIQKTVAPADWADQIVNGIDGSAGSTWGAYAIKDAAITTGKYVVVFVKNGEELKALPIVYAKDVDNSFERLDYGYKTGQANIYYRRESKLFGGEIVKKPSVSLTFDVTITTKTIGAALEKSGVNLKSKKDVMEFISNYN
jgi:Collagen triple helix repeat (20 copies)